MPIIIHCSKVIAGYALGKNANTELALEAWEIGEIDHAGKLAKKLTKSKSEASSGLHLLFLKELLEGNCEEALLTYEKIDTDYPKYGELDKTVVNA